jgi:dipeptidyl aminopeptidase/acylaminoacyl peptidase
MRALLGLAATRAATHVFVVLTLVLGPRWATSLSAQNGEQNGSMAAQGPANYPMASRFAPYKISTLLHTTSLQPNWINGGDRFWYQWETSAGRSYYVVDPVRATRTLIFDNDRIAAELTRITRDPWDGQHLPIRNIRFIDDNTLQFDVQSSQEEEVREDVVVNDEQQQQQQDDRRPPRARTRPKVHYFEYRVDTRTLRELANYEAPDDHPDWASMSPDSQTVVFSREFNLWMMTRAEYQKILDARRGKSGAAADSASDKLTVQEVQLTTDGEKDYSYGSQGRGENDEETVKEFKKRQTPQISWSHDSRWFALTRQDRRKVGELWVVHAVGNDRPKLETYRYDMPGEEDVTQTELLVFDVQARQMKRIDDKPWKDQRMGIFSDPTPRVGVRGQDPLPITKWLSDRPNELYVWRRSRDQHRVDVMVVDPATGNVRTVIEERLNTYVEHQDPWRLPNGDLLWWSERDGWAHLYRFAPDGRQVARLTEGPWHVETINSVDAARGMVFFSANGREEGEDPYFQHLYRVGIDGAGLTLMNQGDFDHRAEMSRSGRFFVNNFSTVSNVPEAALFDGTGRRVMDLEEADFSRLMEAGYRFPEAYRVKAADGITDLYGVMYKPYDFDPSKKYPIIAYVYPGPQTESVSKAFSTSAPEQALAQFGFIVITVGNRGGHPARSKFYHNFGYGDLRDYGLADKKAAIEQLADRFDWVDIDRVGIYGHSGGGFMSTAAMLLYPDFFKVAVSSSGNHDNDVYNQNWSEKHDGIKEVVSDSGEVSFEYDIEKNSELASNLKGHLLLTTGDVDNNVHHAGTFRVANALIRANKRFDLFVFPGQRHGYGNMSDYWFWLRAEYFVKHLLGDDRWSADIVELQRERQRPN